MIGRIQGKLVETSPNGILVDVHGIGFEIMVPMSTYYNLPKIGEEVTLHTHFIVREDALTLCGFLTKNELSTFKLLLKVNGIGAKTALAILSSIPLDVLSKAVLTKDTALISKVPGIGKKTAERLILELQDKMKDVAVPTADSHTADIVSALVALGYSEKEALRAVQNLPEKCDVSEGIRQALQFMVK